MFVCGCVYFLRGRRGIPFYSMLAVLWCIQPYAEQTVKMAVQRTTGTLTGALFGLITIVLEIYVIPIYNTLLGYAVAALMIIPVIYTTVLMNRKNASYFSCVVFLSITVIHIADSNPFLFVLNRVLDTFIGIAVGIAINSAHLPHRKIKDTLFSVELDDMLSPVTEQLTPYSKVELNRMLADGLKLTLMTMRTPASLIEILSDVKLSLPVIVMNGAALYDIRNNSYVKAYIISIETCAVIHEITDSHQMNIFTNALCDDTLVIYYDNLVNTAEKAIYNALKKSPYRNYIHRPPTSKDRVIYLMAIDKTEKISHVYEVLLKRLGKQLKIITYPSDDYEGYSYLKIYNKNSGKKHMTELLCREYKIEKSVNIGISYSDEENPSQNLNKIMRSLKNEFEPLFFVKIKKKIE